MNKNKKILIAVIMAIILVVVGTTMTLTLNNKKEPIKETPTKPVQTVDDGDLGIGYDVDLNVKLNNSFNLNIIKLANRDSFASYLISPYSIEAAFSMLKEGANNNTLKEINNAIPNRQMNTFEAKNRISISNGVFIKDKYKDDVKATFVDNVKTKYNAEVIYDEFKKPDVINNWVKEKTFGLIDKVVENMDEDFVMGLVNTVAIDVEWARAFECESTTSEKFTLANNETKDVEMMRDSSRYGNYIKTDTEEGFFLDYRTYNKDGEDATYGEGTQLEFIAIKPTKDNLKTYINYLDDQKLNKLLNEPQELKSNQVLIYNLPRFSYNYQYKKVKDNIQELGIKEVFDLDNADLSNIISKDKYQLYVSEVIHKTNIKVAEKGTKAAAATYIGINETSSAEEEPEEIEYINIKLDKPFLYIIREKSTKEMLFFGTVYNPNEWKGSTCEGEK